MKDSQKSIPNIRDVYDGNHLIQDSMDQKYLGDIICKTGKNDKNIAARVKKAMVSLIKFHWANSNSK